MRRFVAVVIAAGCGGSHGAAKSDASAMDDAAIVDGARDARADGMVDAAPDAPPDASIHTDPNGTLVAALSYSQTCAIHNDGTLWCWGSPDGNVATSSTIPTQVGTDADWRAVTAGTNHMCAVDGGALYCWGYNGDNELGTGDTAVHSTPFQIGTDTSWTLLAAGDRHTCGIHAGALYCWGYNAAGEAGPPATRNVTTPMQLGTDTDWTAIAAGFGFTCGVRGTGSTHTLWCWGDGSDGQLGNGMTTILSTPTQVGTDTDWAAVASGGYSTCATKTTGTAWCWGRNYSVPTQLTSDTDYTSVANSAALQCGVHGGTLACLGNINNVGVGDGGQVYRGAPTTIGAGTTWRSVFTGNSAACATDDHDAISCWGMNRFGALGLGTRPERPDQAQVGTSTDWSSISVTNFYGLACGLRGDAAYCWGSGGAALGNGTGLAEQVPTLVGTGYAAVRAGFDATCGLKSDHSLWCWGSNQTTGLAGSPATPTQIGTNTDWTAFDVYEHACGIRGGALYCWGRNYYGELGDGTQTARSTPTQVGTDTDWTAVTVDQADTCGIRGGALYCWGYRVNSSTPLQVGPDTDWVSIDNREAGGYACGLKAGNQWWCAVAPSYTGQRTTYTDWTFANALAGVRASGAGYSFTTQIGTGLDWATISGSTYDLCGTHTGGTLTCSGSGEAGELGNGDAWVLVPTKL